MFVSDKTASESLLAALAANQRRYLQLGALKLVLAAEHAAGSHSWPAAIKEFAAATLMTRAQARDYLDFAVTVTTRLPMTLAAMRDGEIDEDCARRVVAATRHLSDDQIRLREGEILQSAHGRPLPGSVPPLAVAL
jgi:hypothetical protein